MLGLALNVGVSVVSHGHFELIKRLNVLKNIADRTSFRVVIRDNVGEEGFQDWCLNNNIIYESNSEKKGFGENNNLNYYLLYESGILSAKDFFLVLNPDVVVDEIIIRSLCESMLHHQALIGTVNLYKNAELSIPDLSVRRFPRLQDFVISFLGRTNPSVIRKESVVEPEFVDWAAGSFLLFSAEHYKNLKGFDERYFMYCEDLDICLRSFFLYKSCVLFVPGLKAIHLAEHASRSIFSPHFWWHVKSLLRYLRTRKSLVSK